MKPGSYDEFGSLATHLRFVERHSRKLARTTFYAMGRWQAKLEKKQAFLGRIVDIGAELFAIASAAIYANTIKTERPDRGEQAVRAGRPVLQAGPRARRTGCSTSCGPTTTTPTTRPRRPCSTAASRGSRRASLDPSGDGPMIAAQPDSVDDRAALPEAARVRAAAVAPRRPRPPSLARGAAAGSVAP